VNYLTVTKGVYVQLDVHNYARYNGNIIGAQGSSVTVTAFQDLWTRLANVFKNNSRVFFGLMNEPHSMSTNLWLSDANAAIQAIRATGSTNTIVVSGNGWDGAATWYDTWYDTSNPPVSNAVAMLNISVRATISFLKYTNILIVTVVAVMTLVVHHLLAINHS
jgi:endoglucanase